MRDTHLYFKIPAIVSSYNFESPNYEFTRSTLRHQNLALQQDFKVKAYFQQFLFKVLRWHSTNENLVHDK